MSSASGLLTPAGGRLESDALPSFTAPPLTATADWRTFDWSSTRMAQTQQLARAPNDAGFYLPPRHVTAPLLKRRVLAGLVHAGLAAAQREYIGGDRSLRRMVDRLAELDQVQHPKAKLRWAKADWELANCA